MTKERIAVAMSGGVDSSIAAYLLLKQGYDVIGVHLKLFDCASSNSLVDVQKVTNALRIPLHVLDYKSIFESKVLSYFRSEYESGRTPNPCVVCNKKIKFGRLLDDTKVLGADFLATGHYANLEFDATKKRYKLLKSIDSEKDQTYFLFYLSQKQFAKMKFPLAKYTKKQVQKLAVKIGLQYLCTKLSSQDACFSKSDDKNITRRFSDESSLVQGPVYDTQGNELGVHKGLAHYTIGQRKLGIACGKPIYVHALDTSKNALIVDYGVQKATDSFSITKFNWIFFSELKYPIACEVKIRYRHTPSPAIVVPETKDRLGVQFFNPQKSVTPGQAAVFYKGNELLGGGFID